MRAGKSRLAQNRKRARELGAIDKYSHALTEVPTMSQALC